MLFEDYTKSMICGLEPKWVHNVHSNPGNGKDGRKNKDKKSESTNVVVLWCEETSRRKTDISVILLMKLPL